MDETSVEVKSKRKSPILAAITCLYLLAVHVTPFTDSSTFFHSLFTYAPPLALCIPLVPASVILLYKIARKRSYRFDSHLVLAIVISIPFIFSYVLPKSPSITGEQNLRVLTHNVNFESREMPELLAYIKTNEIDLVLLQEVKGGELSPASYLQKNLPGWSMVTERETAILARFELTDIQSIKLGSLPHRVVLSATVNSPTPVRAVTCHWGVPQFRKKLLGISSADQQEDYATTMQALNESDLPVILGGDFNCTPRHGLMRSLGSKLTNAFSQVGSGPGLTFSSRQLLVRIDHLFSSPGVEPIKCRVESAFGSDHHSLFAEFALDSQN